MGTSASLLALAAATCYALSSVAVRLGTRRVMPFAGLVLSLFSGVVVLGSAVWFRGFEGPDLRVLGIFALVGLLGPGCGRFLNIASVSRIGASRTAPVVSAAHPLIAVSLGVILLAEPLNLTRSVGIAFMLAGILLAVRGRDTPPGTSHPGDPASTQSRPAFMMLPSLAGASYAFAAFVKREGMQLMSDPLTGAFIASFVAAAIWTTVFFSRREGWALARKLTVGDAKWFLASGIASASAQVFFFGALVDGDLSVVVPIVSVQPILVAILARIFLHRIERVGIAVGVAAVLAATGTVLVSR